LSATDLGVSSANEPASPSQPSGRTPKRLASTARQLFPLSPPHPGSARSRANSPPPAATPAPTARASPPSPPTHSLPRPRAPFALPPRSRLPPATPPPPPP